MNPTATRPRVQTSHPAWLRNSFKGGQQDFTCLSNQLLDDDRIGYLEMAVYQGIARHANRQTGESWPGTETLARYAKCARNSVTKAIKKLVECGYLMLRPGGGGKVNRYRLLPLGAVENPVGAKVSHQQTLRKPAKTSPKRWARTKATEPDEYPYIPASGDTSDDSQPAQTKKPRPLSDARRSEMRQVDCPKCGATAGEPCISSRQRFSLRKYFHAERGDVAALWATEHLTLSSVTKGTCWTCQDAGRTIDVNNTVRPCADCRGGPS